MAEKKTEQQFYTRPPKLGKWESFRTFLWNPETNQVLGRTGGSWGKIILFYIIFYAALIGFFAALLAVFYQTLDMTKPKWQLESSLIGTNPGLGFRPMPPSSNVESTLIRYRSGDLNSVRSWTEQLDMFLSTYKKANGTLNCDVSPNADPRERVCKVDINVREKFQQCVQDNLYSFNSTVKGPCIFLKLNKIYGWQPLFYNPEDLPLEMPEDLKNHIRSFQNRAMQGTGSLNPIQTVWVTCEGENPGDVENIGPVHYYPRRGFSGQYFPFLNQKGYMSPLVAVFFERPIRGITINIECKAWAKNIKHDRLDRRGSVHFELMVE